MRIHAAINERTVRRTFKERKPGTRGLTVIDRDLPQSSSRRTIRRPSASCVRSERP